MYWGGLVFPDDSYLMSLVIHFIMTSNVCRRFLQLVWGPKVAAPLPALLGDLLSLIASCPGILINSSVRSWVKLFRVLWHSRVESDTVVLFYVAVSTIMLLTHIYTLLGLPSLVVSRSAASISISLASIIMAYLPKEVMCLPYLPASINYL